MKKLLSILLFALPYLAQAHPGHDGGHDGGYTIIHFLTTPVHAVPIYTAVLLVLFFAWRRRRKSARLQAA